MIRRGIIVGRSGFERYDYAAEGAYFVTICTHNRECTLGEVVDGEMILSRIGRIADECWFAVPNDSPNVGLNEYQIMPNYVHGIVVIRGKRAEDLADDGVFKKDLMGGEHSVRDLINQIPPGESIPPGHQIPPGNQIFLGLVDAKFSDKIDWPLMKNPAQTLGKVIRHFKAKATKIIHDAGFVDFEWQRGYHDNIIRDVHHLERIRVYIRNNPRRWSENKRKKIERA